MSLTLQFKLTQAGQAAIWNANNTGLALSLTHIQFGSGNRTPSGAETALLNPQQTTPIAAGFSVSPTQIRMSAIFGGNQNYVVREVGIWAGEPATAGAKLVGYWSQPSGDLAIKSPGVDFVFSHDMALDAALPAGSLTILADNAQSAMLAMISAHEAAANPHLQYATKSALQAQADSAKSAMLTTMSTHEAAANPHSQYATQSALQTQVDSAKSTTLTTMNAHVTAANPHPQYVTQSALAAVATAPGIVNFFASNVAPTGWLKCNGTAVSRSNYAALFAVVGTAFGAGDGSTTFNVPDLRGEFLRGFDDGRGVDANRTFGSRQPGSLSMADDVNNVAGLVCVYGDMPTAYNCDPVSLAQLNSDYPKRCSATGALTEPNGYYNNSPQLWGVSRPRNIALLACIKY